MASRPRFRVTAANTATRMAGTTAMAENQATSRTCSRAPARPERRVAHSRASRQPISAASVSTSVRLISSKRDQPGAVRRIGRQAGQQRIGDAARQHRQQRHAKGELRRPGYRAQTGAPLWERCFANHVFRCDRPHPEPGPRGGSVAKTRTVARMQRCILQATGLSGRKWLNCWRHGRNCAVSGSPWLAPLKSLSRGAAPLDHRLRRYSLRKPLDDFQPQDPGSSCAACCG